MAEEFSKLVEQTKLNNDKQDRVIDLLEQANKPEPKRELQRASKDEVDAEYDVLKKGNIFTVAYNRLSGIDRADDILSKELTPAQVKTNAMLDDLTNKNIQQNETLNKIGAALFIGLELDRKLQNATQDQLLLASDQFDYEKKQDNEEERNRLLDKDKDKPTTGSTTSGDDKGGSFMFGGLGALGNILGLTALTLGGSLLGVKMLQDPEFRDKVSGLFKAIGNVFNIIVDEIFTPLFPVLKAIAEFNIFLLTKAFEFTGNALSTLADFAKDIAALERDDQIRLALLSSGSAEILRRSLPRLLGPNGPVGVINRALFGTPTMTGAGQITRQGGIFNSILRIFRPLINLAGGIMTFGVVKNFTGLFGATGTRVGRFMTSISKLFLPLTIALAAYEAIQGFIDKFFETETVVGPAGMTMQQTPPMIRRIVNGVEGALLGLLKSLVYYPLDFLRTSINYITEKLFGVEIIPSDDEILGGLNSLFEGVEKFFDDFANFDARAYINENFPTIAKILDFILGTEVDALIPEIKAQRALESQVARLQKIIDDNQERLDNEDLKPKTREYLENEIAKRQEQIRNLPELLTADEIVERLIKYQDLIDADAGGVIGTNVLANRIDSLNELLAEQGLELQNVNGQPVVVQTSNNQVNNNQGNTVSIGKETTPNDTTFNALLNAGGAI